MCTASVSSSLRSKLGKQNEVLRRTHKMSVVSFPGLSRTGSRKDGSLTRQSFLKLQRKERKDIPCFQLECFVVKE